MNHEQRLDQQKREVYSISKAFIQDAYHQYLVVHSPVKQVERHQFVQRYCYTYM